MTINSAIPAQDHQILRRIDYIDGIRGWAALSVLLFHMFSEMFGHVFPIFRTPLVATFLDGRLAVFVFFILSGDALSVAFLRSGRLDSVASMVVKRYFRLAGPTFVSCLIVYLIVVIGLDYHAQAASVVNNEEWLGRMLNFPVNLLSMIRYGLSWVFFLPDQIVSYNPFLWSMSIELFGSAFIFAYLIALPRLINPLKTTLIAVAFLTLVSSFYALFFTGLALGIMRNEGMFEKTWASLASTLTLAAVVLIQITFCTFHWNKPSMMDLILAELVVLAIYANPHCKHFFSNKVSEYLGKISFPLYLVHFSVLISFTSYGTLWLNARGNLSADSALLVGLLSAAIAIALAHFFAIGERLYLMRLNHFTNWIVKPVDK